MFPASSLAKATNSKYPASKGSCAAKGSLKSLLPQRHFSKSPESISTSESDAEALRKIRTQTSNEFDLSFGEITASKIIHLDFRNFTDLSLPDPTMVALIAGAEPMVGFERSPTTAVTAIHYN